MRTLRQNLWWLCLAVLLLGAPHWLAAQEISQVPADLTPAQVFASPPEIPSAYAGPADTDCALRVQAALIDATAIQHRLRTFDTDDREIPQSQHRRPGIRAAAVHSGQPTVTFARLYPSREARESYRVFQSSGRAPPTF